MESKLVLTYQKDDKGVNLIGIKFPTDQCLYRFAEFLCVMNGLTEFGAYDIDSDTQLNITLLPYEKESQQDSTDNSSDLDKDTVNPS